LLQVVDVKLDVKRQNDLERFSIASNETPESAVFFAEWMSVVA
jgi:hypothetical protein